MKMIQKHLALFCLAVVLILSVSLQPAIAYFTTYAEAEGGYTITLGDTDIEEEFYDWTKRVTISNSEDAQPVYVRALALAGGQYELVYSGDGWSRGDDGYYYYDQILEPGETTSQLLVEIKNVPEKPEENENFNVVVVYESVPVLYHENGDPYADWSQGGDEG